MINAINKYIISIIFTLLLFCSNSVFSQNISVEGNIYEYATYYVSSFDVSTGATNVQIFRYTISSNSYPIFVSVKFLASILSPGIGINSPATIVSLETNPFQINGDLIIDNRDLSSQSTTIYDQSGTQVEISGNLLETLDPLLSDAILQSVLMSGKLPDGEYTFSVKINAGLSQENMTTVFEDNKTFVIQSSTSITLDSPGGALADTSDNKVFSTFPIFQWSSQTCPSCETFIRVSEFDIDSHSSIEEAIEDKRVLPFDQSEDWYQIGNITSYQYPVSGAYPLEAGNIYVWQIRILSPSTEGFEPSLSPVYAFKVASFGGGSGSNEITIGGITDPLLIALKEAIGDDQFNSVFGSGNSLQGFNPTGEIQINNNTVDNSSVNELFNQFKNDNYQINSIQVE